MQYFFSFFLIFKLIACENSPLLVECRFRLAILYLISRVYLASCYQAIQVAEMYRLITIVRLKT
jgi:hypothetical protein